MTAPSRTLLLSALLVAIFILGALGTQIWLRRQTQLAIASMESVTTADRGPGDAFARLQRAHQRALVALALLALVLSAVPWCLLVLAARRGPADPVLPLRRDTAGLERFARLSVERGAALEQAQGARLRAEEDLQLSRSLLDRSLEDRIRLGRELHDNVSQTLYAVTLTLQSVRKKMTASPEIEERLDRSVAELRRLNQEVRAYLRDLEPEAVQRTSLAQALADTLETASAGGAAIESQLDEDLLQLVSPDHAADFVNIVREAVSNSVRHGGARRVSLRMARAGGEFALAIADDGAGFAVAPAVPAGHGLANMHARAAAIGAKLQIESTPGKGTRVILTLPVGPVLS